MCKNLMVVGVKADKQEELHSFMVAMAPILTMRDDDGFGYAVITEAGIGGERWLHTKDAFNFRSVWTKRENELKEKFQGALEGDPTFNIFNPQAFESPILSLIMHARMATCEVSLKNTHPFVRDGIALIHNGVISNSKELKQATSTCDSECILNSYADNKVNLNPDKITEVGNVLRGSYTCGVLSKDAEGKPIVDIFRSSPMLYATYIQELAALVFCTDDDMIKTACKELGWKCGPFLKLKDDVMVRLDATTGEFISKHSFKSNVYSGSGGYGGYGGGGRNYQNNDHYYGVSQKKTQHPHRMHLTKHGTTKNSSIDGITS